MAVEEGAVDGRCASDAGNADLGAGGAREADRGDDVLAWPGRSRPGGRPAIFSVLAVPVMSPGSVLTSGIGAGGGGACRG